MIQRPSNNPKGVLIYGVGNVGQTVARIVAGYGWPVIAVNRAGGKVGQDLGALTGTRALDGCLIREAEETDLSSVFADVAVLAINDRLAHNLPYHRRLMEAGYNLICVGAESSYPKAVDPKQAEELNAIAKANGVTVTGGGLWDTYRNWTLRTLIGPCTGLRSLYHSSLTNADRFGAEVAGMVNIGKDPATVDDAQTGRSIYRIFLVQVVESLRLTITSLNEHQKPVKSDEVMHSRALGRDIQPGLCVGMRTVISIETAEGISATAEIDLRLAADGEAEGLKWQIDGEPQAEMVLSGIDTGHATASSVVNRIPYVLAAPAGLITTDQMPPMLPAKSF